MHWMGKTTAAVVMIVASLPSTARAIPVVVQLTELIQLNFGQDELPPSLGDFYPEVSINGVGTDNSGFKCDNPPPQSFIVPYPMFTEDGFVDGSCSGVPWTFTVDVPLSDFQFDPQGIEVRIVINDSDLISDDTVETIVLQVPFGGRWTGTVDWPENCTPFNGGARVCWQIEVGQDADGDGLLDDWEQSGIDVDGNGTIDLDLPALGADPMHKDIFIELDWRPGFEPQRGEVQLWKEAFAAAPTNAGGVLNPDGLPGINLHVDTGALTEDGLLVGDNLGGGNALGPEFPACSFDNSFYDAKEINFDAATRSPAFHYGITATRCCIFGPNLGTPCTFDAECTPGVCGAFGGQAEIGGNDFIVWNIVFQGSTLMHELGHNLMLRHGGANNDNCKPNYLSVMNYDHDEIQRLDGSSIIDYSPPRQATGARGTAPLDDLDESGLEESAVLDPADPESFLVYTDAAANKRLSLVGAPVDWNGNNNTADSGIMVNIDTSDAGTGDPKACTNSDFETLDGHDDWTNISMPFLQFGDSASGPINPVDDPEPTDAEILRLRQALNTTDLATVKSGNAGPVEAGSQVDLSYTLHVANEGLNPALPPRAHDTLPPSSVVLSLDPTCLEDPTGQLTCNLPSLLPRESLTIPLSIRTTAGCAAGVPVAIVNQASVENAARHAGPDPDPADNTSSFTTAVIDTMPPQLSLVVSPAQLWPPNHKFVPIRVVVTATDVCDDSPAIRLVSITSNEAGDAPGSGHTSPDVQGAMFGTDDRQFELRAERSGNGSGRIYTITYEAEDGSGNVASRSITVTVPKSM